MKTAFRRQQRGVLNLWFSVVVMHLGLACAPAQSVLVITEVMSSSALTLNGQPTGTSHPDWVEFTVYGTAPMNVSGWYWTDSGGTDLNPFPGGLVIPPGESIIFFRTNHGETLAGFQEWWGGCLKTARIYGFLKPGMSSDEDAIRLYDPANNLVDEVFFGKARPGFTFVSEPVTGDFGALSRFGECGGCRAATADDVGSPGTNCGWVPLRIVEHPGSLSNVCAGSNPTFWVRAYGLPRPKYQWQFKAKSQSQWQAIPGANTARLTMADVRLSDEGAYRAVVTNGVETATSSTVWLTVNISDSPPQLLFPLADLERFEGEIARFEAQVCAFPPPIFQWYSNDVTILGATNRELVIPGVALSMSDTLFSVIITNRLGLTNASARLRVFPKPTLAITEAMPAPSTDGLRNWWELTNLGTNAVWLRKGVRHGDTPIRQDAKVLSQDVLLQPGEAIILVDTMTRGEFVRWWGECNLPPGIQVVTFVGYGLNDYSGVICVWSAAAEGEGNLLASVCYASPDPYPKLPTSQCDGLPIRGHSLFFTTNEDPANCAIWGARSETKIGGAFQAILSEDVGSPGWTPWTPPYWTSIHREASGMVLEWRAMPGSTSQVQYKRSLEQTNWVVLTNVTATGACRTITDTSVSGQELRYYRLVCGPDGPASQTIFYPGITVAVSPSSPKRHSESEVLVLTWPTEPTCLYVVQCRTNAAASAWVSLCTNVATATAMSVSNTIRRDTPQVFYRVVGGPKKP